MTANRSDEFVCNLRKQMKKNKIELTIIVQFLIIKHNKNNKDYISRRKCILKRDECYSIALF